MNNDPTPSSSSSARPATNNPGPDGNGVRENEDDQGPSPASASSSKGGRRAGQVKKLHFMTSLMKNLDTVFLAELCTLYYLEYVPFYHPNSSLLKPGVRLF